MSKSKMKLGEILVSSGAISEETLSKALVLQKEKNMKLGETLVEAGFITDEKMMEVLKKQLGIESIDLEGISIKSDIINIIPESLARRYEVLPIDIVNGVLLLAMSDPLNYFAFKDIKDATGYAVKPVIALRKNILGNIEKYYGKNRAEEAAENYGKIYGFKGREETLTVEDESSAPIIKFINTIIENAIIRRASDIHIEPEEREMRVRYREDGLLREVMRVDIGMLSPVISRLKLLADLNIAEKRVPQDGRIEFKMKDKEIDLRISIVPTILGEKVVLRLLDKRKVTLDMKEIGLKDSEIEKIKNIILKTHGIVLVSGPTGSGKTTTIYSILNLLNDSSKNIITIEDPVEYNMKGINQMQVNNKINFTFASGLRSILRQDPDIILVGEIRDVETAEISIRSALTGHLVFSTIHTNSSVATITRLLDMGIEPFLLSSTLAGVIAQRLIRKICTGCSEEYISDEREKKILGIDNNIILNRGKGCSLCNNTGYRGREAIFEILELDRELRIMIDNNISEINFERKAIEKGMISLKESCKDKVFQGITTVEELIRVTYSL